LRVYGLLPLEFVIPSAGNLVLGDGLQPFIGGHHGSNPTETRNYAGLLTIGLAIAWVVVARRGWAALSPRLRQTTAGLVGVAVVAFLLALPSPVSVFGHSIWMPSRLLWTFVPAFRVPSRWVVLVMTAVIPLAALALQAAGKRVGRRSGRWRAVRAAPVPLGAVALVASFRELTISLHPRPRADHAPAQHRP